MTEQLRYELIIDDKGTPVIRKLTGEVKQAEDQMNKLNQSLRIIKWDSLINLAERAYRAGREIFNLSREVSNLGGEIVRSSKELGISTDEFQKWRYVAKMADLDITQFSMGMRFLISKIYDAAKGSQEASAYFEAMGVDINELTKNGTNLSEIIGILSDKFATWKDGTAKLDYAINLFGQRSGQAFINLLNMGRKGIEGLMEEFDRLGYKIDPETLEKLAKMEDQLKRFQFAWENLKIQLTPIFEWIIKKIEQISSLGKKIELPLGMEFSLTTGLRRKKSLAVFNVEEGVSEIIKTPPKVINPNVLNKINEELEKSIIHFNLLRGQAELLGSEGKIPSWLDALEEQMGIISKQAIPDLNQAFLDFNRILGETNLLIIQGKLPSWLDALEEQMGILAKYTIPDLNYALMEFNKILGEAELLSMEGYLPSWLDALEKQMGVITKQTIPDLNQTMKEFYKILAEAEILSNQGKMPSWIDAIEEQLGVLDKTVLEKITLQKEIWDNFFKSVSDSWSIHVNNIIRGAENMGDALKNIFKGIGDAFISEISRMITQWLVFGSITGKKEIGGNWLTGGLWGGLIGLFKSFFKFNEGGLVAGLRPIAKFQYGGVVDRPTLAIVGEGGEREFIIPESKMKRGIKAGDNINLFYIYAMDPLSFHDFVKRNPGAIIEVINKDQRLAGKMRTIIRSS